MRVAFMAGESIYANVRLRLTANRIYGLSGGCRGGIAPFSPCGRRVGDEGALCQPKVNVGLLDVLHPSACTASPRPM